LSYGREMKNTVTVFMVTLILVSALVMAFDILPVKASGTIYIRAEGSIDPSTANITTTDNVTYTFTDDIYDSIVVERSNIIMDGCGYMLQGTWNGTGIDLLWMTNVTVRNTQISSFSVGICLRGSSCTVSGNNITANMLGVLLEDSSYNIVSENAMTSTHYGIALWDSSYNTVSGNNITVSLLGGIILSSSSNYNSLSENNITSNYVGITLFHSPSNNTISGNYIASNYYGVLFSESSSSGNSFYHNNLDNVLQVGSDASASIWDGGYPSGGNYWSDYNGTDLFNGPYQNETGSDGIGDQPYIINVNNTDRYPLVPKIIGIDPSQPIAFANQYLTILGEGFVPDSEVTLSDGSTTYPPIPEERTRFISPRKMAVVVGLGYTEDSWKVWVSNPHGSQSNKYSFQARTPSSEDCKKVLSLALQYWNVKDAAKMTAIVRAESGWSPNTAGDQAEDWGTLWDKKRVMDPNINSMGFCSWGLWQILMPAHLNALKNLGAQIDPPYHGTAKWLRDPDSNVKAAYKVWKTLGFKGWSTYRNGAYKKYLKEVNKMRTFVFRCPVNVTIRDDYDRIISEVENQIPGASFEYFSATDTRIFYLPANLAYHTQIHATAYGNCTLGQITPTESIYETAFSEAALGLTSETVANFDLLPYDANYTLRVDENGDGLVDYELAPEVEVQNTEYDIGVTETVPSKAFIGQGYNIPIDVTVVNYGIHYETFNITLHVNETTIGLQTVSLPSGNLTTLTITWNTAGIPYGNYTIQAYAEPILGETDTSDNTMMDAWILVTLPGDVFGDRDVNIFDIVRMAGGYGTLPPNPKYNPNCDIDGDGDIDIFDIVIAAMNYGKSW
jgi:parallel beta-helix repeat protein